MYGTDRKTKTLGRYPEISLKDARQAARQILAKPPTIQRSVSFSQARDAYLADCAIRLRKSTSDRYYFALKDIRASSLDKIDPNITDPTTLKALKSFYNWCIDHNLTDRNPFIRRKVIFPIRERLLTDEEISKILHYDHKPYSDIVKLLIYTGQRRNQIWRYQPEWRTDDVLTFPSRIMKSNRPHTLPITSYGKYLPDAPYTCNSWSKAKVRIDIHTGVTDWVLHDIRRYFSTTMAQLNVPLHVTEQIIDHRSQVTGVAAIYNLHTFLPEMREALTHYQEHLQTLTG
jgi:integrase